MAETEEMETMKTTIARLTEELDRLKNREEKIVIVQKEVVVPTFRGGVRQLQEFKEKCKAAWKTQNITDESDKIKFVRSHLTDAVKDDLDCYPPGHIKSLVDLWEILRDTYGDHRSVQQLLATFNSLEQHEGEAVRDFANRLNKLFTDLTAKQIAEGQRPQDEQILRDQFITGLRDGSLMRQLRVKAMESSITFLDARAFSIKWELQEGNMRQPIPQAVTAATTVESISALTELTKVVAQLTERIAAIESSESLEKERGMGRESQRNKGKQRQRICFRCGKTGHIVRNCPRKVGSFVGGSRAVAANSRDLNDLIGDCPMATAKIQGREFQALVDSGSQVTMMSERTFKRLYGSTVTVRPAAVLLKVIAADGLEIPFLGYFKANVEVFGKVAKDKGILVRRDVGSANLVSMPDVILGMNVLKEVSPEATGLPSTVKGFAKVAGKTVNAPPRVSACECATTEGKWKRHRQSRRVEVEPLPKSSVQSFASVAGKTSVCVSPAQQFVPHNLAGAHCAVGTRPAEFGAGRKPNGQERRHLRRRRRKRRKEKLVLETSSCCPSASPEHLADARGKIPPRGKDRPKVACDKAGEHLQLSAAKRKEGNDPNKSVSGLSFGDFDRVEDGPLELRYQQWNIIRPNVPTFEWLEVTVPPPALVAPPPGRS